MTSPPTDTDTAARELTKRINETNARNGLPVSPLKYMVLALPPIVGLDSSPLYHESIQTKHHHIYVAKAKETGLTIYQYNIDTNKWCEFYDFGYAVQCCDIGNAIDSINNYLYVISKCVHSFNTILCGLNLHTKQFIFKKVNKKAASSRNMLMSVPTSHLKRPRSELHLLYGPSIHHIRLNVNPSRYSSKYKEYDAMRSTNQVDLCSAKSIYVPTLGTIFVFGSRSRRMSNAVWLCDVRDHRYQWRLYKQRLPQRTSDYGIVQGFDYLVFLFYYTTDNSIWCLDLLTGAMVKCHDAFPLNGFQRIRMLSTVDNHAHFMLINEDYAWVRSQARGRSHYVNKLSGEITSKEPNIWVDSRHDTVDPSKRCNFHISLDLLDIVPRVVRQNHQNIYFTLIAWLIAHHKINPNRFAMDLIHLIGRFVSRLYYRRY
eukprot:200611_1